MKSNSPPVENVGGGRSRSRTCLHGQIPCQQGKEQGFFDSGAIFSFWSTLNQSFAGVGGKFPTRRSREFLKANREALRLSREKRRWLDASVCFVPYAEIHPQHRAEKAIFVTSISVAQRIDEDAKSRDCLPPAGIIDVVARKLRTPVGEHTHEPAFRDVCPHLILGEICQTASGHRPQKLG